MESTSAVVQEGLEYKKQLLNLLETGKIALSDLANITISSDEEDSSDVSDGKETGENSSSKNDEKTADDNNEGEMKSFESKFAETQASLVAIPSLVAQLNTELEMLSQNKVVVRTLPSKDDDLDAFIWKFNITIDWNNAKYPLPIQEVQNIKELNEALDDEPTYHHVVSNIFLFGR